MPATNFNILTGLNVGNVTTDAAANSVATSGNITAGNLASTGLTSTASFTVSGTSNLGAVGNVTITGGAANQVLITNGSGVLSFTNVNTLVGTISSAVANQVTYYTAANTISGSSNLIWNGADLLTVTGNVSASNFSTTGTLSVSGNANVGNLGATNANLSAATIVGNLATGNTSATLFTGNITGTSGVFSGNVTFGNINAVSGILGVSGNITGGNLITTGFLSVSGNANVGNLGTSALVMTGALSGVTTLSVSGNANVGNIGATRGVFTNIVGTLETAAQTNITSVGTLTSLAVTGNITSGNVSGTRGAFTNVAGTLETAAQTNITSVGTLGSLTVSGNATFDTNTLFVDSVNNNVGIGTASPGARLNVRNISLVADAGIVQLLSRTDGPYLGIGHQNWDGTHYAAIGGTVTDGSNNTLGALRFFTRQSSTDANLTERMRIDSSGNVGIGTSSPDQKLTVNGNARLGTGAYVGFPDSGGAFVRFSNGEFIATSGQQLQLCADNNDGTIAFFTTSTGSASNERMRIESSGNVGIGNTVPTHTLSVTGTLNVSGNANVGNLGTAGNITASYFFGNGSQLTGITASAAPSTSVVNGTSNLVVTANGNVTTSVAGTANVLVVTSTGANVAGTVNVTGNATFGNISGTLTTAAQTNITSLGTLSSLTVSGDATFDTNTLFVDSVNNRVGIGTASPGSIVDIRQSNSGGVGPILSLINSAAVADNNAVEINMAGNPGGGPTAPTGRIRLTETGGSALSTMSFWTYAGGGTPGFAERMRINPAGNVGIGNTAPAHTLSVTGTLNVSGNANVGNLGTSGNITASYLFGNGSQLTGIAGGGNSSSIVNGTSNVTVVANGNVTTSVAGTANVLVVTSTGTHIKAGSATSNGYLTIQAGDESYDSHLILGTPYQAFTAGNNYNKTAIVARGGTGYSRADLHFVLNNSADTSSYTVGTNTKMIIKNDGNVGIGNTAPTHTLSVTGTLSVSGNAAFDTKTLYVDATNNRVGIGISNPTADLHIRAGSATSNGYLTIQAGNESYEAHLILGTPYQAFTAGNNYNKTAIVADGIGSYSRADLHFVLNDWGDTSSYTVGTDSKMIIKNNGNVGIGNTAPAHTLSVTGTLNVSGSANVGNLGTAGNITASYFVGNGSQLTGVTAAPSPSVVNGTSNLVVTANGNVTTSVAGTANVLVVTSTGANVAGTFNATGNTIVGGTFNASSLTVSGNATFDTNTLFVDSVNNRVGIGTSAPTADLHIRAGSATSNGQLTIQAGDEGYESHLILSTSYQGFTAGNNYNKTAIVADGIASWSRADLHFVLNSSADNSSYTVGTDSKMIIKNNGNVGIGTSNIGARLTVVCGDSATANSQVSISGGRSLGAGADGSAGAILFTNSYWNSGYGAARISASDSGTSGGHLIFSTTANGGGVTGAPTEKMRILQNGNVGIGTSTPGALLSFGSGVNDNKINLYEGTNDKYGFGIRANQLMIYSGAGGSGSGGITLGKFDGTTFTERMRVTNDGNVGIGNTAPTHTLRVEGTISATGNANVGNIGATNGVFTNVSGTLSNTLTLATSGTGLSGSTTYNNSGAATFTVTSNATSANTASAIVARDASGNFSAGTITATLSGSATSVGGITEIGLFNNMGGSHGARTSFDATTPSYNFGYRYVQGTANGPGTSGSQFYSWYIGLGSEFPATGAGSYGAMFAVDRNVTNPYLSVRYNEGNSFTAWYKIRAGYADSAGTAGTVTTATQGNITSVGTLTSLTVSGNISIGSLGVAIDSSKNFYPGNQTTNFFGWDGYGIYKSGSGYFYLSAGTFYVQSTSVFRGVVSNDSATYLQINGGTSGHTYFNGNVGIGTSSPTGKLHLAGSALSITGIYQDGSDRPSVGLTGNYPQLVLMSQVANSSHGPTLMLGSKNSGDTNHKHWSIGTSGQDSTFLDIGYHAGNDLNPHAGIRNYQGSTWMTILSSGNVGIGETNPGSKLHVAGAIYSSGHHYINNSDPTIFFQDTDNRSAMIHCNSNLLYFLRGSGTNSTGWTLINGAWPLYLNLETNDAIFGGLVKAEGTYGRFATGYDSSQVNSMSCSNWFRSSGQTGWYNATYDGGIWMSDSTYVRVYNGKGLAVDGQISARAGQSSGSIANATGGLGGLECLGGGSTNAAFMTFHRPGVYAVYFGLDGSDLKVGGWSMGAVAYTMMHSGNYTTYTGNIPQESKTSAYTLVAADRGKHISITTGGVTVPASVFNTGDIVTIYNNSGSNQTITQGASTTVRLAGTANTGNRTLAQYGVATVLCVASNTFVISGNGLT